MGEMITITAQDGVTLSAYQAMPEGAPRGGIILLQEIFGVNQHIREVCDSFARDGFHIIAPALFDAAERDVALEYNPAGKEAGLALKKAVDGRAIDDITSWLGQFGEGLKIAVIGYCWGGSLAWRMACSGTPISAPISAAISYYGGELPARKEAQANVPVMAHFGTQDASIPMAGVTEFQQAQSEVICHIYEADHGFNCDHRPQYHKEAATLARQRTDDFLKTYLG